MLRAKIYINRDELEDIQIVNMKTRNQKGENKYEVKTARDSFCVYHDRTEDWTKLLVKALNKMRDRAFIRIVETIMEEHIGAWKQLKDL